jgi:RES domain-containing protein
VGCFLEVFRPWALIPEAEVEARRISRLAPPVVDLADCTDGLCRHFGVTAEIHSTPDYAATQRWAAAFAAAGFGGVRYLLRHDPGQRHTGVALFGPAGAPAWPAAPGERIGLPVLQEVERRFGLRVLPIP